MGREREDKPRDGNRGGLGLFKWESIHQDQDKTHYLGNTVKASTGRWAKQKNLDWFHIEKESSKSVDLDEIAEIKRLENIAMQQALGLLGEKSNSNIEDPEILKKEYEKERESIKRDLKRQIRNEKVIGLGVNGEAKRDLVNQSKKDIKSNRESERYSSRNRSRSPKGHARDWRDSREYRDRDRDRRDRY